MDFGLSSVVWSWEARGWQKHVSRGLACACRAARGGLGSATRHEVACPSAQVAGTPECEVCGRARPNPQPQAVTQHTLLLSPPTFSFVFFSFGGGGVTQYIIAEI